VDAHKILQEARARLTLPPDFVERTLGLAPGRLARLEDGSEPMDSATLDQLCGFFGVPAEEVAAGLPVADVLEPVRILLKTSASVSNAARAEIARVAAARRDVKALERALGEADRYQSLRGQFKHEGAYLDAGAGWRVGKELAAQLREHLGLASDKPVPSMRDLVASLGIELVAANLSDAHAAGFSLADRAHGPAIVVNMRGANHNPWVRRFSIAHELCHVLHDELVHAETPVQLYEEAEVGHEPRANAFAAHFLAPDEGVQELLQALPAPTPLAEQAIQLMRRFGINFKAACWRLKHAWNVPREELAALKGVPTEPHPDSPWRAAEAIWDAAFFPCPSVPLERRGLLRRMVAAAWSKGVIGRGEAVHLLQAAPDEPLEALLDVGDVEV
jgi:Zn-dependent peptidase ImmA (M78 family)